MKTAKYISLLGVALCLLSACSSDLEKTIYNEDTVRPAALQSIAPAYKLEAAHSDKVAVTFAWSKPDVGYDASITSSLEIAVAGSAFQNATVLASSSDKQEAAVTVLTLNKAVLKLLNNVISDEEVAVELRLSSRISNTARPFLSNVITTRIAPYSMEKEYPFIALRGNYNGWDFLQSQKIYSKGENHDYAAMIYFGQGKAANGWKLCGSADWSVDNWGFASGLAEAPETLLAASGGDIKAYSKTSYYVQFNNETGLLKMTKGHDSWGIYKASAASSDVALTLPEGNITQLSATLDLQAGQKWRIRPDGNDQDAILPSDVEHALATDGDFFKVEEDGTYLITWSFNKATPQLSCKKQ